MGLFDRLSTLLRSNINDLISRAENPEKMLNQLIVDMKTNLAKAKQQVASAIADEKKLQADAENMKKQAEDWERRAMLAVQEGRDDMAKQALGRYNEHLQGAQQLHETWLKHKAETDALKLSLRQLNDKIEEAKRKKNILVARAKRAEAQQRIQETMSGMSDKSAFESFERMAEKIEADRAQGHRGGRAQRGGLGRPAGQAVRRAGVQGQLRPAAARAQGPHGAARAGTGRAAPAAQPRRRRRPRRRARGRGRRRAHPLMAVPASGDRRELPDRAAPAGRRPGGPGGQDHRRPAGRFPRRHPRDLSRCPGRSAGTAAGCAPADRPGGGGSRPRSERWSGGAPHRAAGDGAGAGPPHQPAAVPRPVSTRNINAFIRSIPDPSTERHARCGRRARLPGLGTGRDPRIPPGSRGALPQRRRRGTDRGSERPGDVDLPGASPRDLRGRGGRPRAAAAPAACARHPAGSQRRRSGPGWWGRSSPWCCWPP